MKWILDKSFDIYNMPTDLSSIPQKDIVLKYFKKFKTPIAYASSTVEDNITKVKTNIANTAHSDGIFNWTSSLIYHFEKYNLKLSDEFINHVMEQVKEN